MTIAFEKFNEMHVDIQLVGTYEKQVLIVGISGSVDTYNSSDFSKAVEDVLPTCKGIKHLVFDLRGLSYVSSTGIGIFVSILKSVKELGAIEMHLWKTQKKIYDVFQLLGFSQFIHFIEDIGEIDQDSAKKTVEPKVLPCPQCKKTFKAVKAGIFKCGNCKNIITINENLELIENENNSNV